MPILGITGNVATGKSTLTGLLSRSLPAQYFDSDDCARRLTREDETVREEILQSFGKKVFHDNGELNRARLREIVFESEDARCRLEKILHPRIRTKWVTAVREQRGRSYIVDIPLLFETNAEHELDLVIVIGCSESVQRRRLIQERRLTPAMAEKIMKSQMPLAEKIKRCDVLIWNDGSKQALENQVRWLLNRIKNRE